MPIEVELPDGAIAEFPDDMAQDEIEGVLSGQFGASGNSPVATPEPTMGDFYNPPAELPSIFPKQDPRAKALQMERLGVAAEDDQQNIYDYGAAAHTGLSKGMQMGKTMVRGAADLLGQIPGVQAAERGLQGIEDTIAEAVLPSGINQVRKEFEEGRRKDSEDYFKGLAAWEKWMSDRDALLGTPTFGTQLTESVSRGFAELPVQMAGGQLGAARGAEMATRVIGKDAAQRLATQGAVRGSAAGAGVSAGLSQYAQELGEGADRATALGRGTMSGLVTGLTTRAFGATGVESIFRNEGIKGITNHLKRALVESGQEIAEETIDQIGQDMLERMNKNPDKPMGDSIREVLLAGFTGGILGGGIGAVSGIGGEMKEAQQRKAALNQPGMPLQMPMQIEGGETDASKEQEAATVHGDVRPSEQQGQPEGVPQQEGGPGVQPKAKRGLLSEEESPMTQAESKRYKELWVKMSKPAEDSPMSVAEIREFDVLNRRFERLRERQYRTQVTEANRLVEEAVADEGIADNVEIVEPSKIDENNPLFWRLAQYNLKTGKIQINSRGLAEDLAKLPPERRAQMVRSIINEENVHSRTTTEDATQFNELASGAEKALARRIYTGRWSGEHPSGKISDTALGFEVIRRRVQRLNRMTPTEIAASVGKERWTLESLDLLDRMIAKTRQTIGTTAIKEQLDILDRVQNNIKVARQAIDTGGDDEEVGALRREVEDFVTRLNDPSQKVNTVDAVDAGFAAESIEDLEALRQEKANVKEQMAEARKSKDFNAAFRLGSNNQMLREAIETAASVGSNSVEMRRPHEKHYGEQPSLDWKKNPEVKAWLEKHSAELGISPIEETVGAHRRGLTKKEEQAIEQQRKYREAMGKKPVEAQPKPGPEAGAAPRKVPRKERLPASEFFAKPTPESITQTAADVLSDQSKLPSFKRFLDHVRSKHGDIQAGQVSEAWVDNVWKHLNAASGADLNSLVDRLGLRRQVFGIIPQGSKTFGLKGPPPTLERTGEIADPVQVETGRSMIQKAMERAERLTNKAQKLEDEAKGAKSVEDTKILEQRAEILRRTAAGIEAGAAKGEGIELKQDTLFPGVEARTSSYTTQKSTVEPIVTKGTQLRARDRAIAIIGANLINQGDPIDNQLKRKTIGPEDIRWHEMGAEIYTVTPEDLQDLDQLGMALTKGAGTDASTKRLAGGGRFVVRERGIPRSATKRVVELRDKKTGKIYLVSGWRSARGPVFVDPHSVTGENRTLEQLIGRFQPVRSFPLDKPVQNFFWKFDSKKEYDDKFYDAVKEMDREVGYRGYEPGSEHTPIEEVMAAEEGGVGAGVEGEGGFVQGPEAGIVRAELGMVEGAREMGFDLSRPEARQLYREFRFFETGDDAQQMLSRLRRRAERGILRPKDHVLITAISKVNDALTTKEGAPSPETVLNEIYALTQRLEKESSFAQSVPSRYAQGLRVPDESRQAQQEAASPFSQELTMPLDRVPPTLVRPEQLPAYAKPGGPLTTGPAGLKSERERPRTEKDARRAERKARFEILREEKGRKPTEEEVELAIQLQEQKAARKQAEINRASNQFVASVNKAVAASGISPVGELALEGKASEASPLDLPKGKLDPKKGKKVDPDQGLLFALRRNDKEPPPSYHTFSDILTGGTDEDGNYVVEPWALTFDELSLLIGWPIRTRKGTPGSFEGSHEEDDLVKAVEDGRKPVALFDEVPLYVPEGLKVVDRGSTAQLGRYALVKQGSEWASDELDVAIAAGDHDRIGKALGFTAQERNDFKNRSARLDEHADWASGNLIFTKEEVMTAMSQAMADHPDQQSFMFALRRLSQEPNFWTSDRWKTTQEWLNREIKTIGKNMAEASPEELSEMRLRLNGMNQTIRTILRDSGLKFDDDGITPLWETVRSDLFNQAGFFVDALQLAESVEKKFPQAGQQELGEVGALRRDNENEGLTLTASHGDRQGDSIRIDRMPGGLWKAVYFKRVTNDDYQIFESRMFESKEDAIRSAQGVGGIKVPGQTLFGSPHPIGHRSFTPGYPITNETVGALRRNPPTTVAEATRNLVDDFGSVYDRWMVERIAEYGGRYARQFAGQVRTMMSREKQLYGGLTPLIDRARRLAGGIDPGRASGMGVRAKIGEIPDRVRGTANAMKAGIWLNRVQNVTPHTGVANVVGAIEDTMPIPAFARAVVRAARVANMEIGRLLQQANPNFIASGLYQRNLNALGYDIIRSGGGVLWNRWTEGIAHANSMSGATLTSVREHFREMKTTLDQPRLTHNDLESIAQDFNRTYPNAVTHVRHLGSWRPVIHSDLFNYIENAARRATHVVAFREQYPNDDIGRARLHAMMNSVRGELAKPLQGDLDSLLRALHGHPTDDFNSEMLEDIGMTPQQLGGAVVRGLNQTLGNVAAKAVLTGQMFVQPGELVTGSTPVFLGYQNYLRGVASMGGMYSTMELNGSVNRVMSDYILNLNSPASTVTSGAKVFGNVLAKVSMQNFLNEMQEAAAAATARVVSENIITGNLSAWERRTLPQTFSMMGFSDREVHLMMRGDPQLLGQFQRKAAAWLTGGNKAVAEGSRLSTRRLFNSMFRFQTYPMVKANQFRRLAVNWADAMRSGNGRRIGTASEMMARFIAGNLMQGALTAGITTLAYAGLAGTKIKWEEVKDEPLWFAGESFMASMSGPLYLLWRGMKQGGLSGVGEQATRVVFPWAITQDIWDMTQGQGIYRDTDDMQKIGRFLANKTPMTKAIGTGLAMTGLGNHSQPLDVSITAMNRWKRDTFSDEGITFGNNEERRVFRTHVRNAVNAMKRGDREKYIEEWMAAGETNDMDSIGESLLGRRVLRGPSGRELTPEEKEALQQRIGFEAYERLEHFDRMLEVASKGVTPVMDRME